MNSLEGTGSNQGKVLSHPILIGRAKSHDRFNSWACLILEMPVFEKLSMRQARIKSAAIKPNLALVGGNLLESVTAQQN